MSGTPMHFAMDGTCNLRSCVRGDCFRFTVLTDRIIRLEYDPEGIFEDRPSQTVLFRNFPRPDFSVRDTGSRMEIDGKHFHLTYYYGQEKRFTEHSLTITAKNNFTNYGATWRFGATTYGDPPRHHNLYGTARTLDKADGAVPMDRGLMDTSGHSFFDDSHTALFGSDGTLHSRREGTVDVYYVCCQHDYGETLKDFFRISGAPPMIPRYALGNWWSRYYSYSSREYLQLMERFRQADVPFSMAVLDMDWHITDVESKYGRGWTGYTWNRQLIPEPKEFLRQLHERDMHILLNLHPADGVQGFEEGYPQMAEATGADAEKEEPVLFDMTDPAFTEAYFRYLIHPLEEDGVDHWWIDWQQGRKCVVPNLDPLWLLNHYHYTDNDSRGKRGLILSRYAGLGSHRYPAGFSGDTVATWDSLDFQAYFNITATNAGFVFWSHDIGGFTGGIRDGEMFVRWLQLGVFSAFLRLHATNNPFASKEPWRFGEEVQPVICNWLRLRHKLIPYLYTEMYRQNSQLEPLVRPMYYAYPEESRAYQCKNQYLFGSALMVCPITAPADSVTGLASVRAWIPDGVWTDIFTGKTYSGNRVTVLNRPLSQYPVLAKAGAVIPMAVHSEGSNFTGNPDTLEVYVFSGASGSYTMFEDDGIQTEGIEENGFFTEFTYDEAGKQFCIRTWGNPSVVPEKRTYRIVFRGFEAFTPKGEQIKELSYDPSTNSVQVQLRPVACLEQVSLELPGAEREEDRQREEMLFQILNRARMSNNQKKAIFERLSNDIPADRLLEELLADRTDLRLMEAIAEIIVDGRS